MKAIRLGCPIKDACGCAHISEELYYAWRREAEEGKSPRAKALANFMERIKEVEGEATQAWLAMIEKASREGKWQAAAWKLERRRGMVQKVQQEVSGPDGQPVKVEARGAVEALLEELAGIARSGSGQGDT